MLVLLDSVLTSTFGEPSTNGWFIVVGPCQGLYHSSGPYNYRPIGLKWLGIKYWDLRQTWYGGERRSWHCNGKKRITTKTSGIRERTKEMEDMYDIRLAIGDARVSARLTTTPILKAVLFSWLHHPFPSHARPFVLRGFINNFRLFNCAKYMECPA